MNKAVIDTIQTYCRQGNRESVLNVFRNFPEHFSCIPLNDSNVESKQAINDLLRENVSQLCYLDVPESFGDLTTRYTEGPISH